MTGAMTNPMNGFLRLWKEKLLLRISRQEFFFFFHRALTNLDLDLVLVNNDSAYHINSDA